MPFVRDLVIILLSIIMAGASQAMAAAPRQLALGVAMLPGDRDAAIYDGFAAQVGRSPALWSIWSDWGADSGAFPDIAFMDHLKDGKTVPLIFWQPVKPSELNSSAYTYRKIVRGDHDDYIQEFARAAKAFGGRVLIRFAHEMEGYWFPWGMGRFDNTPYWFKKAWKHIWNIFRGPDGEGATNVRFVWSPNGCHSLRKAKECGTALKGLYPGDKYVDYLAFSAFNWGSYKNYWRTVETLMAPKMVGMQAIPGKPIIVAETASAPHGNAAHPGNKADWIDDGYKLIYSKWPRIKAVVYFNVDMRQFPGGVEDWRLESPKAALDVYRNLLTKTRFRGRIP